MKPSLAVLLILVIAAAAGIGLQQRTISRLRAERSALREQVQIADRLKQENTEVVRLRELNQEVTRLRGETRELHRLRNEIRRLNEQVATLEPLRTENRALKSATAAGPAR